MLSERRYFSKKDFPIIRDISKHVSISVTRQSLHDISDTINDLTVTIRDISDTMSDLSITIYHRTVTMSDLSVTNSNISVIVSKLSVTICDISTISNISVCE